MNLPRKIIKINLCVILLQIVFFPNCESFQKPAKKRTVDFPAYKIQEVRTKDWDMILFPEFKVFNNVWGKDKIKNYSQKIFKFTSKKGDGFGWSWKWPVTKRVVAYPEVIFGGNSWHESRSKKFPRSLKDGQITVSYNCSLDATKYCNFALEFWLHSDKKYSKKNITHEIMIWQLNNGMKPAGTFKGIFIHNGVKYELYINDSHEPGVGSDASGWRYIAFVAQEDRFKDKLHLHKFINYLVKKGFLKKDLYISGIEFGTEILGGEGVVLFHDFRVSVKK